jgi:uncharacterized protein DUF5672
MTPLSALIIENRPIPGLRDIIDAHEKFLPKGCEVYWVKNEVINSIQDYNRLLTSKRFWRAMPSEKVLIIQHDSMLLREGIEEFMEWDYVGAPWSFQTFGGNGGLSLRDVKAMLKVIDNFTWQFHPEGNEDVWFCNCMHQLGMNLAPRDVCSRFSVESIYQLGTLGYHAIDKWLTPSECDSIRRQYL